MAAAAVQWAERIMRRLLTCSLRDEAEHPLRCQRQNRTNMFDVPCSKSNGGDT
jgi:hypothetical protein